MADTRSHFDLVIEYDPIQRDLYRRRRPSVYDEYAWPVELRKGRNKHGCFPEVAVRRHFERSGYKVLLSEPEYPELGFLLFHYSDKREKGHVAFKRLQERFENPYVDLNAVADRGWLEKRAAGKNGEGGDPDLFVFRPDSDERFFVEVKHKDDLHLNQLVCFPLIREHLRCEVKLAKIRPMVLEAQRA